MLALAVVFLCLVLPSSASAQVCTADCDGNRQVTVDEIVTAVAIALGSRLVGECPAADSSADGNVTVDEIVSATNNALDGCPAVSPTRTSTASPTPTATATSVHTPPTVTATPSIHLDVGSAQGAPGTQVTISLTLTGGDGIVVSASSDITYDATQVAVARPSGQILCNIAFTDPPGSGIERRLLLNVLPASGSNEKLRIGILSIQPLDEPLPDGVLINCDFAISPTATAGGKTLVNAADVADFAGISLGVAGGNGVITVVR